MPQSFKLISITKTKEFFAEIERVFFSEKALLILNLIAPQILKVKMFESFVSNLYC